MTEQEAIEILKKNKPIYDPRECRKELCDACDIAISALEKQIPKKPVLVNKNKEPDGNWKMVCPSCGCTLIERITTPEESYPLYYNFSRHCNCGQAIVWNENEDYGEGKESK